MALQLTQPAMPWVCWLFLLANVLQLLALADRWSERGPFDYFILVFCSSVVVLCVAALVGRRKQMRQNS